MTIDWGARSHLGARAVELSSDYYECLPEGNIQIAEREYLSVCARGLPNKFQQTGVVMLENWVKIGGIVGGGEGGIEGNKMDLGIVFFLFGTKLALQTVLIQWILCWRLRMLFLE